MGPKEGDRSERQGTADEIGEWRWPDALTDEQLADLRVEMDRNFGPEAAARFFQSFQSPMSVEVMEIIRRLTGPTVPPAEAFLETHEHMRRLVGDRRVRKDSEGQARTKTNPDSGA